MFYFAGQVRLKEWKIQKQFWNTGFNEAHYLGTYKLDIISGYFQRQTGLRQP